MKKNLENTKASVAKIAQDDSIKTTLTFGKIFLDKFKQFDVVGIAAQSAYYLFFSLMPMLIFLITLLPFFIDGSATEMLLDSVANFPKELQEPFTKLIEQILLEVDTSALTLSLLITIWSASSSINAFVKSINRIYEDEFTRNGMIFRLISIFLTIGFVATLLLSTTLFGFGDTILDTIDFIDLSYIFNLLKFIAIPAFLFLIFFLLYFLSPTSKLRKLTLLPGAFFATGAFMLFTFLFFEFMPVVAKSFSEYGPFASIMILLLWFYSIGLIIMSGAVLNSSLQDYKNQ